VCPWAFQKSGDRVSLSIHLASADPLAMPLHVPCPRKALHQAPAAPQDPHPHPIPRHTRLFFPIIGRFGFTTSRAFRRPLLARPGPISSAIARAARCQLTAPSHPPSRPHPRPYGNDPLIQLSPPCEPSSAMWRDRVTRKAGRLGPAASSRIPLGMGSTHMGPGRLMRNRYYEVPKSPFRWHALLQS